MPLIATINKEAFEKFKKELEIMGFEITKQEEKGKNIYIEARHKIERKK